MSKAYWLYLLLELLKTALLSMLTLLVRELAAFLSGGASDYVGGQPWENG